MKKSLMSLLVVGALAALAGCGDDDGGEVREVGGEGSESASASGSGSGSGSASGSGSGSGSGRAMAAECVPVGDPETADTTIAVTLDEWTITPAETTAPAGAVLFATENIGEENHELVIAEGTDLPTAEDGSVDESQLPDGALIGEIEAYPAGETCDGVFELAAGTYTLFCNIVEEEEDGTVESHVEKGMVTTFTVE